MKYKILLFNIIFLIYAVGLIALDATPANDTLPAGAITQLQQGGLVYTVAFSPDGRVLASGGTDNAIILWDIDGRRQLNTFTQHSDWVKSVAFSPGGRILVSASLDGFVRLWELSSNRRAITLKHSDYVESVAFSPDGRMLASAGSDGSVRLWNVSKTQSITTIAGHRGGVSSVAFSPDGRMLASASYDGTLKVWSVSGSEIRSLTGHKGGAGVLSVAFSPDGRMLASGSKNNTIKLWAIPSGKALATFEHDYVESIAFSPDGKMFASASADYTVKLWSTSSHAELVSLKGHRNRVTSVAFSPGGETLASGSRDGTILVWDLSYFDIESSLMANLPKKTSDPPNVEKPENPISTALQEFLGESGPIKSERKNLPIPQDTTPPTISLDVPTTGLVHSTVSQFTVQGSVTDNGSVDEVKVNNLKVPVLEDGTFTATVQLSNGKNLIRVIATDTSGNVDTSQFTIIWESEKPLPSPVSDPSSPTIIILSPTERVLPPTVKDILVTGIVTDNDGIYEIQVNGMDATVVENGGFRATVLLGYGDNEIVVTATDTKLNKSIRRIKITRSLGNPPRDTTGPEVRILDPPVHVQRGAKVKPHVVTDTIRVTGTATDPSGIYKVTVNETEVPVSEDRFIATVRLVQGDNRILVKAIDTWHNITMEEFTIVREEALYKKPGTDYALLFATESYDYWGNLRNPLFDAQAIRLALQEIYGFQVELIHNPTQKGIIEVLRRYAEKEYADEDQLLIFFAGHGYFDTTFSVGYLVAKDTRTPESDKAMISYLSHSVFRDIIDRMGCKHIFLVMDTCYSGTFDHRIAMRGEADKFKPHLQADIEQKLKYMTRWYLTSGAKEQVSDGIPGRHSPFARELLEALRSKGGSDSLLTIEEILTYFEKLNDPKPCSDEFGRNEPGSDFLFITK